MGDDEGLVVVPLVVDEPGEARPVLWVDVDAVEAERLDEVRREVVEDFSILFAKLLWRGLHRAPRLVVKHADGAAGVDDEQFLLVRGEDALRAWEAGDERIHPRLAEDPAQQRGLGLQLFQPAARLVADDAGIEQKADERGWLAGGGIVVAKDVLVGAQLFLNGHARRFQLLLPHVADVFHHGGFGRVLEGDGLRRAVLRGGDGALRVQPRCLQLRGVVAGEGMMFFRAGQREELLPEPRLAASELQNAAREFLGKGLARRHDRAQARNPVVLREVMNADGGADAGIGSGVRVNQPREAVEANEDKGDVRRAVEHDGAEGVGELGAKLRAGHVNVALLVGKEAVNLIQHYDNAARPGLLAERLEKFRQPARGAGLLSGRHRRLNGSDGQAEFLRQFPRQVVAPGERSRDVQPAVDIRNVGGADAAVQRGERMHHEAGFADEPLAVDFHPFPGDETRPQTPVFLALHIKAGRVCNRAEELQLEAGKQMRGVGGLNGHCRVYFFAVSHASSSHCQRYFELRTQPALRMKLGTDSPRNFSCFSSLTLVSNVPSLPTPHAANISFTRRTCSTKARTPAGTRGALKSPDVIASNSEAVSSPYTFCSLACRSCHIVAWSSVGCKSCGFGSVASASNLPSSLLLGSARTSARAFASSEEKPSVQT